MLYTHQIPLALARHITFPLLLMTRAVVVRALLDAVYCRLAPRVTLNARAFLIANQPAFNLANSRRKSCGDGFARSDFDFACNMGQAAMRHE